MHNVLILHCHDLGRFVGAYGVETVSTPHLDALAAEGTLFETAFSTAPHCSPARASLFTGTYPQSNGVLGLTHEPFAWDLRDPRAHIAARLTDAGYRSELIGVHHESRVLADEVVAERLGFASVQSGGARDLVVERAYRALDEAAETAQPFYLQVGFDEPHRTPSNRDEHGVMGFLAEGVEPDSSLGLTVPSYLRDDESAREEIAELQGAVRYMDEGVGRVLERLEQLGLAETTIVVFTTDHGLALPRAKCSLYDSGLEVALLMRVPQRDSWAQRKIESIVSHVDVAPTLLELLGLPAESTMAGTSLVAVVEDDAAGRTHAFSQLSYHTYYDPKRAVRSATHKLIANFSNAPRAMDPTQSWVHRTAPIDLTGPNIGTSVMLELYDLAEDPDETKSIIDESTGAAARGDLAAALLRWMRETNDPLLDTHGVPRRHQLALEALEEAASHVAG